MILKGEIFKTASDRPKQRGRNDIFRLVPETREEAPNVKVWSLLFAETNNVFKTSVGIGKRFKIVA